MGCSIENKLTWSPELRYVTSALFFLRTLSQEGIRENTRTYIGGKKTDLVGTASDILCTVPEQRAKSR